MGVLEELCSIHEGREEALIEHGGTSLLFQDFLVDAANLEIVRLGDVVALVGDFDSGSINTLLRLFDKKTIVVPLTSDTRNQHDYFIDAAQVDVVIEGNRCYRVREQRSKHPFIKDLRDKKHAGLILFSSGTTGRPKAILHDFTQFLIRYRTPRPALKTLTFLMFDHIGGINTLLHTLYNKGRLVIPTGRTPEKVVADIVRHRIELLPTTPTFLRMLMMSGLTDQVDLSSLKIVTYGTEPMDPTTLDLLCQQLPEVDFRQTYGMSELGILRVKSKARNSLWMKIGGEGVTTDVDARSVLMIKSESCMVGYLNAPSPFKKGWFDTGDIVEQEGDWYRIVGRNSNFINVAGLKVLPEEVERATLSHSEVLRASAKGCANPITGQHIELTVETKPGSNLNRGELKNHLAERLPEFAIPHKFHFAKVAYNYRFKKGG